MIAERVPPLPAGEAEERTAGKSPRTAVPHVLVVGPSYRFASGLSAYTHQLTRALAQRGPTSALLLRRLVPTRLYPGRTRVGEDLGFPRYDGLDVFDGVDWYWGLTIVRAVRFLVRKRPQVVVLQWWTLAAVHTYAAIALVCRALRIPTVIEFHELQDPAEGSLRVAARANRALLPRLVRLAAGAVVHNQHDRDLIATAVTLDHFPTATIPHGPYEHFRQEPTVPVAAGAERPLRLLFFGLIRPYKGLEDLIAAFNGLDDEEIDDFELRVVGETWEGWTLPAEAIEASPYGHRISFVNRYVRDDEVAAAFAAADVLVLPYRRASSSGPLNIAMAVGLPVLMYDIPSLMEAAGDYEGLIPVPQGDVESLREGMRIAQKLKGLRFGPARGWDEITATYTEFLADLAGDRPLRGDRQPRRHRPWRATR